jgi:hypothetical protein
MVKNLFKKLFLLILGSSIVMSDSIQDQIDSIILIDESYKSEMQQRAVVGCDNTLQIAEVKCSKKRDTNSSIVKITTLPKSDKRDDSKDVEMEKIKSQLSDILKQLAELQKVKENNKELREQLKKVTLIQKLVSKDDSSTRRAKEIKVIQVNSDHVIIRVQEGESLSKYAQKYYGNSKKYHNILRANPDKIDKSLQIYIDDELIIPTSISYKYREIKTTPTKEEIITPLQKENLFQETIIPLEENENNIVEEIIYLEEKPLITKVKKGVDIFQLAVEHYGDEKQYYNIYNSNRDIIGADMKLKEGMELRIPTIK